MNQLRILMRCLVLKLSLRGDLLMKRIYLISVRNNKHTLTLTVRNGRLCVLSRQSKSCYKKSGQRILRGSMEAEKQLSDKIFYKEVNFNEKLIQDLETSNKTSRNLKNGCFITDKELE